MKLLHRLLLLPCLAPLLVVLAVAGLNLNKPVSLRVLTWRSSTLPLGVWMALGGTAGAGVAFATGFSLSLRNVPLRRQVHRKANDPLAADSFSVADDHSDDWHQQQHHQQTHPLNETQHEPQGQSPNQAPAAPQPAPERDIRDPSPTVSVPFRVIRTGAQARPSHGTSHQVNDEKFSSPETVNHDAPPSSPAAAAATATAAGDWGAGDWGAGVSDEW
ncbi:MAG: hypothetical protein AB8A39_07275 [Prochlorococcus sp.]